jgi:hypothetical protein
MNTLTRPYRWFGLEIHGRRYAIDFNCINTVFYQPGDHDEADRAVVEKGPFLGIRGLMVHEGSPVFLLPPSRLFTSATGPLDAAEHDGGAAADAVASWVVIFNGDSISSVGIRVERASGPFRMQPEMAEAEAFSKKEIQHLDQWWTVVRLRPNVMEDLQGEGNE